MPGTELQLTPLQVRKQLLLTESEVNRVQLQAELAVLKDQLAGLSAQCNSVVDQASQVITGLGSLRSLWSEWSEPRENGGTWLGRLSAMCRAGFSVWQAFKANRGT